MGTNWQGEKILSLNVFLQNYPSGAPLSPRTRLDLPWLVCCLPHSWVQMLPFFHSARDFSEIIEPFYVPYIVLALSIPCEQDVAFLFLLGAYSIARVMEK